MNTPKMLKERIANKWNIVYFGLLAIGYWYSYELPTERALETVPTSVMSAQLPLLGTVLVVAASGLVAFYYWVRKQ